MAYSLATDLITSAARPRSSSEVVSPGAAAQPSASDGPTRACSAPMAAPARFLACCSRLDALSQGFGDHGLARWQQPRPVRSPVPCSSLATPLLTPYAAPANRKSAPADADEEGDDVTTPSAQPSGAATPSSALACASKGVLRLRKLVYRHLASAGAALAPERAGEASTRSPPRTAGSRFAHALDEVWQVTDDEIDEMLGVRAATRPAHL